MKKKAMVVQTGLISLILFAVVLLALGLIFKNTLFLVVGVGESGSCSAEAVNKDFQDSLSDKLAGFFRNPNIYLQNCHVDVTYIENSKAYPINDDPQKAEESVDAFMAQEAVQCYNQFKDLDIFPSAEKIPTTRSDQSLGGWKKALNWITTSVFHSDRFSFGGNNGIKVQSYYSPPVYCAVCSKVEFDETFKSTYASKDELPMFDDYLKDAKNAPRLITTAETAYDFLDQGRHTGYTELDTLERYSYDPTKTNVIVYYRRYSYEYSWNSFIEENGHRNSFVPSIQNWVVGSVGDLITGEPDFNARVINQVSRESKEEAIPRIQAVYEDTGFGLQIGFFSLLTIQDDTGLYKWFSPFKSNMVDEYGVASVPYEYVAHQCDFLANGYGKVST